MMTLSSGQMDIRRWEVPVLVGPDLHLESLVIFVARGQVHGRLGAEPIVIPPQSDDLLCESIRQAREVAESDSPIGGAP